MEPLYYDTGPLFTMFYGNAPDGEYLWRMEAPDNNGLALIFTKDLKETLAHLAQAGVVTLEMTPDGGPKVLH